MIGNGVVVNPKALLSELQMLKDAGVTPSNLKISSRAHLILPYHIQLDIAQEKQRGDQRLERLTMELARHTWIRPLELGFGCAICLKRIPLRQN